MEDIKKRYSAFLVELRGVAQLTPLSSNHFDDANMAMLFTSNKIKDNYNKLWLQNAHF